MLVRIPFDVGVWALLWLALWSGMAAAERRAIEALARPELRDDGATEASRVQA